MSYPLSTFITCISGINNCTNNFTLNEDYVISGKSCVAVLTSEKWFDVTKVITPKDYELDYFSIDTDLLSGVGQVQVNPYDNQPYLTGGNFYTNCPILCVYEQTISACNVYEGITTYIAEKWLQTPGGGMNLLLKGNSLQTLYVINCVLTGINIDPTIQLSNLQTVGFINTFFITDAVNNNSGNSINKFLNHLALYGPNNGSFYSQNDLSTNLNNLNVEGRNALFTLTGSKSWYVSII